MKFWMMIAAILFCSTIGTAADKIVWNGKTVGKNKAWGSNATAVVEDGVLEVNLTGKEWSGGFLNWEGHWPEDAGTKMDDYKYFVLWIKVNRDLKTIQVTLQDNKRTKSSNVNIADFVKGKLSPKKFKKVVIPVKEFKGEKSQLKTGVIWEFMIHAWSKENKNIKIEVDKIAFSNKK